MSFPKPIVLLLALSLSVTPAFCLPGRVLPSFDNPLKEASESFDKGDYQTAVMLLSRVVSGDKNNVEALVKRGVAYVKLKQREKALQDFDRAKQVAPDSPRVALVRGACLYEMKHYDEALPELEMAASGFPADHFPAILAASSAYHIDDFEKSLKYGQLAVSLGYKPDYSFHLMQAECLAATKRYKEASELFAELCASPQVTAQTWVARGNLERVQEHFSQAMAFYDRALAIAPGDAQAIYHRALCRLAGNKTETGLTELRQAVSAYPDNSKLRLFKADLLFKLKHYDEALADYKYLQTQTPQDFHVFKGEASILALQKRYEELLVPAQRACRLQPTDASSQLLLGTALAARNKDAEAERAFTSAIKYSGNNPGYRLLRARFYCTRKRYQESLDDYDAALVAGKETDEQLAARLLPLFELNLYDRAIKDVNTLHAHGYSENWIYLVRGTARASLGDFKTAVDDLEKYARKAPKPGPIYTLIAKAQLGTGNPLKAIEAADLALKYGPDLEARKLRAAARFANRDYEGTIADIEFLKEKNVELDRHLLEWQGFAYHGLKQPERGQEAFSQMIARFPDHYSGYADLALYYIDTGRLEEAQKLIQQALLREQKQPQLYMEKAELDLLSGNDKAALEAADQALSLKPDYLAALELKAGIAFKNSSFDETLLNLNKLIDADPANWKNYLKRAAILDKLGEPKKAEEDRHKAFSVKLSDGNEHLLRADLAREHGLIELALADYKLALKSQAGNPRALFALSDLYAGQGRQQDLKAFLLKAQKDITYKNVQNQIAFCLSNTELNLKHYERALAALTVPAREPAMKALVLRQKLAIYLAADKLDKAQQTVDTISREFPDDWQTFASRARLLKARKKDEEALNELDKALKLDIKNVDLLELKAHYLSDMKEPTAALAYINTALIILSNIDLSKTRHDATLDRETYSRCFYLRGLYLSELGQEQAAIESFTQAVQKNPNNAAALVERGQAFMRLDQLHKAISDYRSAMKIDADNWSALSNLADCFKSLHNYKEAVKYYDLALAANPKWREAYYARANCRFMLKDYKGALADYNLALKHEGRLQEIYINRGGTLGAMGDYQGLLRNLETAKTLGKPTRLMLTNEAIALNHLNRRKEALEKFQAAIALEPKRIQSYLDLATFYAGAKDQMPKAFEAIASAMALEPDNPAALKAKFKLESRSKNFREALKTVEKYLSLCPQDLPMQVEAIRAELTIGQPTKALSRTEALLAERPKWIDGWFELGNCYFELGRTEEALQAFQKVVALDKTDQEAMRRVAQCQRQLGDYESALKWLEQARANSGDSDDLALQEAITLLSSARLSESKIILNRLARKSPQWALPHLYLGQCLILQGKYDDALSALRRCSSRDPELAAALSSSALAQAKAGQLEASKESIARAVALGANDSLYYAACALINHLTGKEEQALSDLNKAESLNKRDWSVMEVKKTLEQTH
ncbi:MAG: tetratricopeptide repeat protein [Candidatus Melainabacteria bacterium]|nr:tetratricopeptide repeat protein [Candidatus Melainabacteria bacterium]